MQTLSNYFKKNFGAILSFAIPFIIYVLTLHPTITTEDSAELITSSYFLGIGHPPGYPLYIIISKIFSIIIPFGDIAWRINLVSAFFGALTAFFIYLFFKNFISEKNSDLSPIEQFTALTPALLFSFLCITWSQSVRAEVYSLHNALTMLTLFVTYLWHLKPQNNKLWYALCFSFGLALTNHHMILVYAPMITLFVIWTEPKILKNWKKILSGIGFFILPLFIYLYLPLRAKHGPIHWSDLDTPQEIWEHFNRAIYVDKGVSAEEFSSLEFQSRARLEEVINPSFTRKIIEYFELLAAHLQVIFSQFYVVLIIPAFAALLGKKDRKFKVFLLTTALFYTLLLPKLIDTFDANNEFNVNSRPFLLPSLLTTSLLIGIGLQNLKSKFKKTPKYIWSIIFTITIAIPLIFNFNENNNRNNYVAYDLNKFILESIPENSALYIPRDESHTFGMIYLQEVEKINPTVTLYGPSGHNLLEDWPGYTTLQNFNPGQRAFFITTPPKDNTKFKYLPTGFTLELIPEDNYDKSELRKRNNQAIESINALTIRGMENPNLDIKNRTLVARAYKTAFSSARSTDKPAAEKFLETIVEITPIKGRNISLLADSYQSIDQPEKALEFLEIGVEQDPDNFEFLFKSGAINQILGNNEAAINYFNKSREASPKDFAVQAAAIDLQSGNCESAFNNLMLIAKEHEIYPHAQAANCFNKLGDTQNAIKYYQKALEVLPETSPTADQIKNKIKSLQ